MIHIKEFFGARRMFGAALFALYSFTGCQSLTGIKERFFYEKLTVVNPLLESPTWLPSLRIVRPAAGVHEGMDQCRYSGGTIDPRYDYWLLEWPDVIYFETVLRDGRPVEVETRDHEICLTKVTHASTLQLDEEPDETFTRLWEIEFESDTGHTGPRQVKRHRARLMNVCVWKGKKVALWRYDDRICMPNRKTVTDQTRSFQFLHRKQGRMVPVHGWDFVSVADKHLADPRPGGSLKGIESAGQARQKARRVEKKDDATETQPETERSTPVEKTPAAKPAGTAAPAAKKPAAAE